MNTRLPQAKLDRIIELFNKGLLSREIAKIMDISPQTMWRVSKQLSLKFPKGHKSPLTSEQLAQITKLAAQNITARKVSELMGVGYRIICNAYKRLGLKPAGVNLLPFTEEQNQQVIALFNQGHGTRHIAKVMCVTRDAVKNSFEALGLDNSGRSMRRTAYLATEKLCKMCGSVKSINQFRKRVKRDRVSYETYCLECEYIFALEKLKERAKRLRQTDPNFVIRSSVSYFIWKSLKNNGATKRGESCLSYLEYSIDQLKKHLESQFQPWMTWDNHGIYNSRTWDDHDPVTWTWQIDHIIPQSVLPYTSMTDNNFQRCWALLNLRPLSAKQNHIDGVKKTRHIAA